MSNEQTIIQIMSVRTGSDWMDYCRCTIEEAQSFLQSHPTTDDKQFRAVDIDKQPYRSPSGDQLTRAQFMHLSTPKLSDHVDCVGLIVGDKWWHCPKHKLYEWNI